MRTVVASTVERIRTIADGSIRRQPIEIFVGQRKRQCSAITITCQRCCAKVYESPLIVVRRATTTNVRVGAEIVRQNERARNGIDAIVNRRAIQCDRHVAAVHEAEAPVEVHRIAVAHAIRDLDREAEVLVRIAVRAPLPARIPVIPTVVGITVGAAAKVAAGDAVSTIEARIIGNVRDPEN